MGRGIMLIRRFVLKVINNERKILGDRSSVQRIKIVNSSEFTAAKFLIYYSFKFTYFCIVDI